jgi:Arc/MetJ family transcription regulator
MQFGSRPHHSAEDAATYLHTKVSATISTGYVGALVLFDISRFFNHIDADVMAQTLECLGIPLTLVRWTHSFMSQRTVRLSFNGQLLDPFDASSSTPQGSLFSPLLSALFTSPILRRAEQWPDGELCMYIDDGSIYVGGATFGSIIGKAMSYLETVAWWLGDFGLRLDVDKTELMVFRPSGPRS